MLSMGDQDISTHELEQRVVYTFLRAAGRVARQAGLCLKEVESLATTAFFHELKDVSMSMRESAELLGVSMRKVALLSKALKGVFLEPEAAVGLPRQLEFMLLAAPLSRARIAQALPQVDAESLDAAIAQLLAEERVAEVPGRVLRYRRTRPTARLVRDTWMARVDGLHNLTGVLANVAWARFFDERSDAFARTVTLRLRAEDVDALQALYEDTLWPALEALDRAADESNRPEEVVSMELGLCWAPLDYLKKRALAVCPREGPHG